jgi:hydroxypyruvate reductase
MKTLAGLRRDAVEIFQAGLEAVDAAAAVGRCFKRAGETLEIDGERYNLASFERVYLVGAGKAVARMAGAVEEALGRRLTAGIVNVKYGHGAGLKVVKTNEAGHPLPNEAGARGTREIIELLERTGENGLIICLLSGGGSALLCCPAKGLTLEEKQETTRVLLGSGARIHEINAIRKHLSQVKGGRLARLAHPATLVSLILSDTVGDDPSTVASGPTSPDPTTFSDCLRILRNYGVQDKIPAAVRVFLEKGARGEIEETPKSLDPVFRRCQNVIVGSNALALEAARRKGEELGYHAIVLSGSIEGEAREVAKVHVAIAREIAQRNRPVPRPACIVSGGETTVTVRGRGSGGRNQEFALAAAVAMEGLSGVVVLSGDTDGSDGATDAAGAFADGTTRSRASGMGLDAEAYLAENDSYTFFKRLGDLYLTGPTLTNVMDLRLVLVGGERTE